MSAPAPQSTSSPDRDPAPLDQRIKRFFGQRPGVGAGAAAKAVVQDASDLVKAELALAKAELAKGAKAKAAGVAALVVAGVFGWLGLQGLLITLALVIAIWLPLWAGALIVTLVLLLGAGIAGLIGKKKLEQPANLDTTKQNVQEDVQWAKAHLPSR